MGNYEVLNGKGKKSSKMDQVRIEKMNANEPLMKCRENALFAKTYGGLYVGKSTADNLITGCTADVTKEA
jgi:hypothetical protein